jgi:hypothetical protein
MTSLENRKERKSEKRECEKIGDIAEVITGKKKVLQAAESRSERRHSPSA